MYKSGADYRPKSLSLNFTRNTFGYTEQYTSQRSSSSSPSLQVCTHISVNYLPFEFPLEHQHSFLSMAWIISLAPPLFWASPLQFHVTCKLLLSLLLKSISLILRASMNEVYTILIGNTFLEVFLCMRKNIPSVPLLS